MAMKDPTDIQTTDMHQPPPKRRGRPPTGKAMTPAERKRKQRTMDFARITRQTTADGNPVTVTGLIETIAGCARMGLPDHVMVYAQQLADRIRAQKAAAEKP